MKLNFFFLNNKDSSSDDGSIPEENISTPDREYNLPRDHIQSTRGDPIKHSREHGSGGHHKNIVERRPQQNFPSQPLSDTSSAGSRSPPTSVHRIQNKNYDLTDLSDIQNVRPCKFCYI